MQTKLIQTKDYLLLIDEEAEIKYNTIIFESDIYLINIAGKDYIHNKTDFKIIAYYPLNSEAKELDLPLLPNPFEKEIDKTTLFKNLGHECFIKMKELNPSGGIKEFIRIAVEFGYKAAQSNKRFSLEDVEKAIKMATWINPNNPDRFYSKEEIIQSLSTQQLPKEFVGWLSKKKCPYDFTSGCTIDRCDCEFVFETIINSEGKKELVGTYKY